MSTGLARQKSPSEIAVPVSLPEDDATRVLLVSDDEASNAFSPLLKSMFGTLRELYVYCEANGRADIAGEVVDALSMCRQDFAALVERLTSQAAGAASPTQPVSLVCNELSPTASPTTKTSDAPGAASKS